MDNDLFDPDASDQGLFTDNTPAIDPTKDYVADLVGEGKKYKDANALAISKLHGDQHIGKIEAENLKLRQELQKRLSLEEFYEKVKTRDPQANPPSNPAQPQPDQKGSELNVEQVESLLETKISQREAALQAKSNIQKVAIEAEKALGPGYKQILAARARELRISPEVASGLAAATPEAFIKLFVNEKTEHFPSAPRTEVRGTIGGGVTKKTLSYFKDLANKDPKYAKSEKFRKDKHDAAMQLGEEFFDI